MSQPLSHQLIQDAASSWLSKPYASLVVQELTDASWLSHTRLDVVGVTPNAQRIKVVECKSSRADWLRGRKNLERYLQFCHQLYVAAPRDVVKKDELPEGVGLLIVGPKGNARAQHWASLRPMTPENYKLVLERVVQKLVVARWRPPFMGRRPGQENKHWPGDGCEDDTYSIKRHLKHQDELYWMAWEQWIAQVEEHEVD